MGSPLGLLFRVDEAGTTRRPASVAGKKAMDRISLKESHQSDLFGETELEIEHETACCTKSDRWSMKHLELLGSNYSFWSRASPASNSDYSMDGSWMYPGYPQNQEDLLYLSYVDS